VLRAVTYNLGCAGPHVAARVKAADEWAAAARADRFDLVFVQELPSQSWLDAWEPTHHVIAPNEHGWKTRSALLVSRSLACKPIEFPTSSYHDSYVAAATVVLPDGREETCASVHASPSRVTSEWQAMWEKTGVVLPSARAAEDLWDADLLLASIIDLVPGRSLLIAGDWNEARAWDKAHPGSTAGDQFFALVDAAGLVDCTWNEWGEERATCAPERAAEAMQLDHIFATRDIASTLRSTVVDVESSDVSTSDHRAISFSVAVDGS
jgi:endonuclease/exonuclease/phosphatase family metal-dependent hydrolase